MIDCPRCQQTVIGQIRVVRRSALEPDEDLFRCIACKYNFTRAEAMQPKPPLPKQPPANYYAELLTKFQQAVQAHQQASVEFGCAPHNQTTYAADRDAMHAAGLRVTQLYNAVLTVLQINNLVVPDVADTE